MQEAWQTWVIAWGRSRDEFWRLHPVEFWWAVDAERQRRQIQDTEPQPRGKHGKAAPRITRDEAIRMKDELKHARVAAGYPAE